MLLVATDVDPYDALLGMRREPLELAARLPHPTRMRIGHSIGLTLASMKETSSASRPYFAYS